MRRPYSSVPVKRGLRVQLDRHHVRANADGVEEPAHRLGRLHDPQARVETAQIHVQVAVREPVRDAMRPVHGESGLADAGSAGDRGHRHRTGLPGQLENLVHSAR
jgi:hypothetical protein